jgi:hypothetical protein
VKWRGGLEWDWSEVFTSEIDPAFKDLIYHYLKSPLSNDAEYKGWKIPETTLVFPWIIRMFPDIKYIFWVRNPRDCILGAHLTDDLSDFGISFEQTDDIRLRRAISWIYQYKLVKATPKPKHWIELRFEDFILDQPATLARLEKFLGIPLVPIPVRADSVGRYKLDEGQNYNEFFEPAMKEYGYEIPV